MYSNYYNLHFNAQGCPMKKIEDRQVFHPILAAYLIYDLVCAYESSSDPAAIQAAQEIAEHSLKRSAELEGAVVFYYSEEDALSTVPGRFYSALTQSWYIRAFCRLDRHAGNYAPVVQSLFSSLLIPKSKGGVLIEKPFGWIVEEYPHEPAFYTLNGWLTVLRWVIENLNDLDRCGVSTSKFLERNIDAAAKLLPLFNADFCLNSRYQLTGFSRIQVIVDRDVDFRLTSFAVEIPGEGIFQGALLPQNSRWKNYLERVEGRLHQFNIVMSLISVPQPNLLHFSYTCRAPCNLSIRLAKGAYRPDSTGMPTERWDSIAHVGIDAPGHDTFHCQIPFDAENMFAYPTNFKKQIRGRFYNGYHFVHIVDCAELFRFSSKPIFREYALKFLSAWERWPELGLGDAYAITPHLNYPGGFSQFVNSMLGPKDTA